MKTVYIEQAIITDAITVKQAIDANNDGALLGSLGVTQEESEDLAAILEDHADMDIVVAVDGGLAFFASDDEYETWAAQV